MNFQTASWIKRKPRTGEWQVLSTKHGWIVGSCLSTGASDHHFVQDFSKWWHLLRCNLNMSQASAFLMLKSCCPGTLATKLKLFNTFILILQCFNSSLFKN